MLMVSAALGLLHTFPYVFGRMARGGWRWGFSNRDVTPDSGGWVGRAERAHKNYLENLPLFGIVLLAAVATGHTNQWTACGAMLFVAARIAFWGVYIAGIPYLRTVLFHTGNLALLMIGWQVLA